MPTEAQILANRRNSQRSTGPRTDAGKQTSRMNALKTGIHAQSQVIQGEDPADLARLADEYNAEFHPVTPRQRDLVDTMVQNEWRIRRLRYLEAEVWHAQLTFNAAIFTDPKSPYHIQAQKHPQAIAYDELEQRLCRLDRRLHGYERSTQRALKELRALQALETEPASDQIGFVPSDIGAGPSEDHVALASEPQSPSPRIPHPQPRTPRIGFVPSTTEAAPARTSIHPESPSPRIPHPQSRIPKIGFVPPPLNPISVDNICAMHIVEL